ncbi:Pentatricopeptide repeat-containing protein [Platanthera guangdongensis]|uniref:Pentatricopeptide repeat-containing protein n=1 Tax=Platanthera guangdongensis TaxID=2320717 RepID=A0ABR2N1M4_9ASPA
MAQMRFMGLNPFGYISGHPFQSISSSDGPDFAGNLATASAVRLQSCAHPPELARIHALVLRRGLLILSFHWNSLMRSYLRLSSPGAALRLFVQMTRSGVSPDHYSLPIALKAAFTSFAFSVGCQLHSVATKNGLAHDEFTESGIVYAYAKFGEFSPARQLFDESPNPKLGSWNALISSYAQAGHCREAVDLFVDLRRSGEIPDDMTMVSLASAGGSLGDNTDIVLAAQIHRCAIQASGSGTNAGRLDLMISNSLIDMYAKCGGTDIAFKIFDRMLERDVSSWTSMIMALTMQGNPWPALELFRKMAGDGVAPNHVTMVAVLSACSHAGLVEEGMMHFESIVRGKMSGVEAVPAHYGCVADMLGKVGRVGEAADIVERMPWPANAVVWGALLGACEKHGEVRIGERAAKKLLELEPWNDGLGVSK